MPIENERKFVLSLDFDPGELRGWTRTEIKQAYLDDGPRLRAVDGLFHFTYKKWISHVSELVEIETEISAEDFALLWSQSINGIEKTRYQRPDASGDWVVDFLRDNTGALYFVVAEVEMPRGMAAPESIVSEIAAHVVHRVDANDKRFTNKRLANVAAARRLYDEITSRL